MAFSPHLLVVRSSVDPKIEKDWNEWYDTQHLSEIKACPGFKSGTRYLCVDDNGVHRYLAVYELTDANALNSKEFAERRGWGPFTGAVDFESRVFSLITK